MNMDDIFSQFGDIFGGGGGFGGGFASWLATKSALVVTTPVDASMMCHDNLLCLYTFVPNIEINFWM